MRHLQIIAALSLFALLPAVTPAATPTWMPATAMSVTASANGSSTFVIHAYVTLPLACYDARVRTALSSSGRVYFVEQLAPPATTTCSPKNYKCSVISASIPLPSPQTIHVSSAGQTWKVHMTMHDQTPMQPVCHKAS